MKSRAGTTTTTMSTANATHVAGDAHDSVTHVHTSQTKISPNILHGTHDVVAFAFVEGRILEAITYYTL